MEPVALLSESVSRSVSVSWEGMVESGGRLRDDKLVIEL